MGRSWLSGGIGGAFLMDKLVLGHWQTLAIRLVLGGVFVWAGTAKLVQIPAFVETVAAFAILPVDWVAPFALSVIWIELIAGGLLLLDIWPRSNALVALMLLVVFSTALGINMYRGNDVTCGCFGGGGETSLAWSLLRDVLLAGGAAVLLVRKEQGNTTRRDHHSKLNSTDIPEVIDNG